MADNDDLVESANRPPARALAVRAILGGCGASRLKLNADNPQAQFRTVTVGALIDRYLAEELDRVRHDTQVSYKAFLNKWIRPKWGTVVIPEVKTIPVEAWLT
jgi:hypothetical protein